MLKGENKEEILLFGLFSATSSAGVYRIFIKQTVKHFLDFYHRAPSAAFQSLETDGIQSNEYIFESALHYTHEHVMEEIASSDDDGSVQTPFDVRKMHFLLGAILGDSLYVCSAGTHVNALYIYPIFRKEGFSHYKVMDILGDGKGAPEGVARLFSNYMSGTVSISGSILVLCNRAVIDYLTPDQLKATVTNIPAHQLQSYFENLFGRVHSKFDFSALFVHPQYSGPVTSAEKHFHAAPNRSMEGLNSTARGTTTILSPSAVLPLRDAVRKTSGAISALIAWITPHAMKMGSNIFDFARMIVRRLSRISWKKDIPRLREKFARLRMSGRRAYTSWRTLIRAEGRKEAIEIVSNFAKAKFATCQAHVANRVRSLSQLSKVLLLLSLLFLALFTQSLFSLQAKKALARDQSATQELVRAAELKCDLAEASILYADDARARSIVTEAQALADLIPVRDTTTAERMRISQRIEAIRNKIDHVIDVKNPRLLLNLSEAVPGAETARIAGVSESGVLLATNDALYRLGSETGKIRHIDAKVKLPLIGCAVMSGADRAFICTGKDLEISEVNLSEETTQRLSIVKEAGEDDIRALSVYNKKLYVLSGGKVYRHLSGSEGFGKGSVIAKGDAPLTDARGLSIDGAVYILSGENTITQFVRSDQNTFPLPLVTPPIARIEKLITIENHPYLYALDREHARIIVVDKETRQLKGQIRSQGLQELRDFIVVPGKKSHKVIVLNDTSVYQLSLEIR